MLVYFLCIVFVSYPCTHKYTCTASAFPDAYESPSVLRLQPGWALALTVFIRNFHLQLWILLADAWPPRHPVSTWIWDGDTKSEAVADAVILISVFPPVGGWWGVGVVTSWKQCAARGNGTGHYRLNCERLMLRLSSSIDERGCLFGTAQLRWDVSSAWIH